MQTTRMRNAKVLIVLCMVGAIFLLYLALRLAFSESNDDNTDSLRAAQQSHVMEDTANELSGRDEGGKKETKKGGRYNAANKANTLGKTVATNKDVLRMSDADSNMPQRRWYPVEARSDKCRKTKLTQTVGGSWNVTLIVDFELTEDEEQDESHLVEQLQTTVDSLLSGGQRGVEELIIVGYGRATSGSSISSRMSAYVDTLKLPHTKVLHRAGSTQAAARTTGFKQSTGAIIVFSDVQVVGTIGWLRPLVSSLAGSDSTTIMQPHFDDASKFPAEYLKTAERLVVQYAWPLMLKVGEYIEAVPSEITGRFNSPAVRGNIFAVKREFFETIGGYDVQLSGIVDGLGVATHVELSLRTWMCGGSIQTEPCSRIGLRDLSDGRTVSVRDEQSVARIAELWFGERKNILLSSISDQVEQQQSQQSAYSQLPKRRMKRRAQPQNIPRGQRSSANRKCRNIDWYFAEVAMGSRVPSYDALHFGQLRSEAGLCTHVGDDLRVDMVDCFLAVPFELTTSGMLRGGNDQCLTVQSNSYVFVEPCHDNKLKLAADSSLEGKQQWRYLADSTQLVNPWSSFCAMHVTDPENHTKDWRQIVMAQNCSTEVLQSSPTFGGTVDSFTQWTFVNV